MRRLIPFALLLGCIRWHPALYQYVNNGKTRVVAVTVNVAWSREPDAAQVEEARELAEKKCGKEVVLGFEALEPDGITYSWAFLCKD